MKKIMKRFSSITFYIILCCLLFFSCKSARNAKDIHISSHGSIVSVRQPIAVTTSLKVELASLYVENKDSVSVPFIDNPPFSGTYMPPRYKDGWAKLVSYLESETHYPLSAQENGIQGRSCVSFCMDRHGDITNIEILWSIDSCFDRELIRVIENIPDEWLPAIKNNAFIDSYIDVCFLFKFESFIY